MTPSSSSICISGAITWEWFGWEHGFNPRKSDGIYLARKPEQALEFKTKELPYLLVSAADCGEQGLVTAGRTTHPSGACYASSGEQKILVTLGQRACAIEIDRMTGSARPVIQGLQQMPHGMTRFGNGWIITNTMAGEIWLLDSDYRLISVLSVRDLSGNSAEAENHEWVQTTVPVGPDLLVSVDANRGLIAFAPERRLLATYAVDEDWAIQTVSPVLVK